MPNLTLLQNFQRPDMGDMQEFTLLLVESEDGVAGKVTYHAGGIAPTADLESAVDEAIQRVNAGIANIQLIHGAVASFPPISKAATARLKEWCGARWTPEIVAAWEQQRADAAAASEIEERVAAEALVVAEKRFTDAVDAAVERRLAKGQRA